MDGRTDYNYNKSKINNKSKFFRSETSQSLELIHLFTKHALS